MTAFAHLAPTVAEINTPFVPIDPESLDATRPVDLDVCPFCQGDRAIHLIDQVTGEADAEECSACAGTGIRGAA